MNVESYIPQFAFSSNFQEIILSVVKSDVTFVLSKKLTSGEYIEILRETYVPDNDLKIYILGLSEIIASNISGGSFNEFRFHFSNKENTLIYTSKVILSRAEINISAAQFVESHFLTLMQGDRTVQIDSVQFLSLYVTKPTLVKYAARYRDLNGNYSNSSGELADLDVIDRTIGMAINLSAYEKADHDLVKFAVIADNRTATFLIDGYSRPSVLELIFVNNFGVSESFAVMGSMNRENKYSNELGYMQGKFKKYHIEALREYTVNTGVLDQNTANWIEDLYNSENVYIARNKTFWKEITITDATVKRSSLQSELPSHEFKYRLSQRNQVVVDFKEDSLRIHDDSFDYTFN